MPIISNLHYIVFRIVSVVWVTYLQYRRIVSLLYRLPCFCTFLIVDRRGAQERNHTTERQYSTNTLQ